jgi:hypothetical protein
MMAMAVDASAERVHHAVRVERAAWAALILGALLARIVGLGDPPLDGDESRRALEAWTLWREGRVAYAAGPLLPNLLSILFGLFTAGDGQARLVSAIAGSALVAVPILFRPAFGVIGTWSIGLVTAVCPLFLVLSRTASPAILVVLFTALSGACTYRFVRDEDPRWLLGCAVSVVLGLASDASFVVALAALVLAAAIAEGDAATRPSWWVSLPAGVKPALAVGLGVAIVADTRFLMNLNGVQAGLIDPLWRWLSDVSRGEGLWAPVYLLLLDGGVVLLALIGLADFRRHYRAVRILGAWLLVALTLAMLVRQPDARYLAYPLIPATLLAGLGLERLVCLLRARGTLRTAVVGVAGLVPLITAGFHVNSTLRAGQDPWLSAGIIVVAGLLLVAIVGVNVLRLDQLPAAAGAFVLLIVALWGVTTTSRLLDARGSGRVQFLGPANLTDEVRIIREEALRWFRADPTRTIPVDASLRPVVAWILRDIPTVRYESAASQPGVPRVLAQPPATLEPGTKTTRLVVGYTPERATPDLRPASVWRWVVGRQTLVQIRPYAIVLVEPAGS